MIFANIPIMLNISRELLAGLEKRVSEWHDNACIGDLLLNMVRTHTCTHTRARAESR